MVFGVGRGVLHRAADLFWHRIFALIGLDVSFCVLALTNKWAVGGSPGGVAIMGVEAGCFGCAAFYMFNVVWVVYFGLGFVLTTRG